MSPKSVIPECCIDSCLFNVLLNFENEQVNHTKGNATVISKMISKFHDKFCLAVIDQDKQNLKYIDERCEKIEIESVDGYFRLFKAREKHHYIIQIVPEIETWIVNVVTSIGVKLDDFNIHATNAVGLAKITKAVTAKDDPRFRLLFKKIVRVSEEIKFEPVVKLKLITNLILHKNYKLDIKDLINAGREKTL